ncbi:MAG: hypothetical protein ACI4TJ_07065 [Candidatus Cryptobacteroides sp.]
MKPFVKTILSILAASVLLPVLITSCSLEPSAAKYLGPRFSTLTVQTTEHTASLSCKIDIASIRQVSSFGFLVGEDPSAMEPHTVGSEASAMTLTLKGLASGRAYYCQAFVKGSGYEYCSDLQSFRTEDSYEAEVVFKDKAFREYALGQFDLNRDGIVTDLEAGYVTSIDIDTRKIPVSTSLQTFQPL